MEDSTSGTRIPKACLTCAKAKVRCEPEVGGVDGICKRCHRLNKPCGFQTPGAHRRKTAPSLQSSEVSALEAKLDRMVALLAASDRSKDLSNASLSPGPAPSAPCSEDMHVPSEQEGQRFISIFINKMLPLFPFVPIPSQMTADQLRREKPFLYRNIVMVASQDAQRHRQSAQSIMQHVAEHIVLRGEHNIDLLQGLLVHIAWYITISRLPRPSLDASSENDFGAKPFRKISSQLDVLLHLATAQLSSLNLNQSVASLRNLNRPLSYMKAVDLHPNQIPERTLEERRAYLGCYYVSVILSLCVREVDTPRFSRYTDECCEALQEALEYPTDAFLVHLVKIMRLGQKIHYTVSANEMTYPVTLDPFLGMTIKSYQAELQELRSAYAPDHPGSEMILYRVALGINPASACADLPVTQLDLLFNLLEANKTFFLNFYSIPSSLLPILPFTVYCQFGVSMMTLSRLILYEGERVGWDPDYTRRTVDFDSTADVILQKLDEARAFLSSDVAERPEIFHRLVTRMQVMKDLHRKRLEAQAKANLEAPQEPLDFSFIFNLPTDAFFPYGDYATASALPEAPNYY
ncbi:hypothetical protein N7468_010426 [Penicillium chermesinum]|uniref:Zn(2)-C6 fungal-type domain-containing protein n=1 Tax=Penicillium chermesinum TaxID=63820 RepID=A0A9W9NEL8_9EURO|nr:uncharacterized protein N7468_010426 [Penicillium chermesinum]KAJ5217418.1 hypothetical protein N7468_010426 [Penicillium chermesinum]KAJ6170971.1 hypothetical protein N7470_000038 [Penicillium chermesinum]